MAVLPVDAQITFLSTDNLAATAEFYKRLLGLPLVLDQGTCRIYQVRAGAFLGFCERQAPPADNQAVIFTLVSDQVDEWYRHLTAHAVPIEKKPTLNPEYEVYHFFLRDPNGYLIEIQRFNDPRWKQVQMDNP
jgi:catechol 2,3-dioxygenase-like lactoylglutathione lyase family enzyme